MGPETASTGETIAQIEQEPMAASSHDGLESWHFGIDGALIVLAPLIAGVLVASHWRRAEKLVTRTKAEMEHTDEQQ
ncbi:hypothetical protein ACFL6C_02750 [Myxococcota bacterium]